MSETNKSKKHRIRIRNLIIRCVLIVSFTGIVLTIIANLVIPAMTNTRISIDRGEQTPSNVGLSFIVSEESEIPLDLQLIQSFRREYDESAVGLYLSGVVLSGKKLASNAEQICLKTLWIIEPLPFPEYSLTLGEKATDLVNVLIEIPGEIRLSYTFDDFCAERGKIETQLTGEDAFFVGVLPFTSGLSRYYYPFDTREIDLEVWVEAEIEYEEDINEGLVIAPNVHSKFNFPDWQMYLFTEQKAPENQTIPVTSQQLTLQRPFASRLLTTTLLSALFVIIILLAFTRQLDGFIQASVAVLLTLLGIQDLLVPAAIDQTTLMDQAILGFYILFALVVLARLTIKPIWDYTSAVKLEDMDDGTGE